MPVIYSVLHYDVKIVAPHTRQYGTTVYAKLKLSRNVFMSEVKTCAVHYSKPGTEEKSRQHRLWSDDDGVVEHHTPGGDMIRCNDFRVSGTGEQRGGSYASDRMMS